jgi:hypothetical protein
MKNNTIFYFLARLRTHASPGFKNELRAMVLLVYANCALRPLWVGYIEAIVIRIRQMYMLMYSRPPRRSVTRLL